VNADQTVTPPPIDDQLVNLLLVDDQPAKLLTYEAMLAGLPVRMLKASSAREALDLLLRNDITIVLMDVSMPEIDGFELAEMIRQHPRYQKTAIIFVSAVHLTDFDRLRGYEYGAVDYVSVPVIPDLLRAKVNVFAELYRKTSEFERLNAELEQRVAQRTAELQAAVDKQRELAEKLRAADRRKDEFLALLAHELRNPLAPVRNAVSVLRRKDTPDPQTAWCYDVIERQTEQLKRLVDDLLDVSRITQGKIQLRRDLVSLGTVISDAIETSGPIVQAKNHALGLSLPDEEIWLRGDASRLTQVIANLLNNAAKYQNAHGEIRVDVRRDGEEAVVAISDRGIGMTAEMVSEAFELFSQGDRTPDRAQGGLGIGLSLVKQLVELHGGSVRAESDGPGKGSTFTVRLPCEAAVGASSRDDAVAALDDAGARQRILVVDDNGDAADSLAILLRLDGHDVQVAYDGARALELARDARSDVVLLDIGLPGMDGYEVCRRLRARHGAQPRLIAMTGYGQNKDRQQALEAGFDEHTVKPVDVNTLRALLVAPRRP
jgi:signal transduction histidine kinase